MCERGWSGCQRSGDRGGGRSPRVLLVLFAVLRATDRLHKYHPGDDGHDGCSSAASLTHEASLASVCGDSCLVESVHVEFQENREIEITYQAGVPVPSLSVPPIDTSSSTSNLIPEARCSFESMGLSKTGFAMVRWSWRRCQLVPVRWTSQCE